LFILHFNPGSIPQFAIPPILSDTPPARLTVTYATQITLFRILLIPVFIAVAIYYGDSVSHGQANETLRWTTIAIFAVAAISDAIDGYVARHFNQKSRLGAILDPLADKLLLLSAIITLSFTGWRQHFPLWFPILVIFRDLASIGGAFLINHLIGKCHIQPHWTGKVATFAQFAAVLWLMLDIPHLVVITVVAGTFTAISGFLNLAAGIRQVTQTDPAAPGS
jgi:CDP-diacylglycerol--glycerol-3-phosphate 3-phosphatidyltransferase/cardiolipin synthase